MLNQLATPKIRSEHLDRLAFIYVRQSSLVQVLENTASTARQYDLVQRALDLGWPQERIVVIDQDQGHSGASTVDRDGFQYLIAQVSLGQAGGVFSLEASRLARSCSDWYRLIEICALTETLVIDEEGAYDPGQYNDRLLLGFKGTMSEAELHWLHNRLQGGRLQKARQGQLRFRLPAGYVYDANNQVVFDPDEQVQHAVRLVFDMFDSLGSGLAVAKYFDAHQLLFPFRFWGGKRDGELIWSPLLHGRVLQILHNPFYTGTYVYGRTRTRRHSLPGEAPRTTRHTLTVPRDDWDIVLHDAHPAYISWDQFLRNLQRLDDNCTSRPEDRRGAPREGAALLQGIALCGQCGQRLTVHYRQKGIFDYRCAWSRPQFGKKGCQSIRGNGIDLAVSSALLEALQPAQIDISLATLDQLQSRAQHIERQWQLCIERAQYEADLARRRFLAVEPENRLVARNLERDWNDKLAEVERLQRECDALPKPSTHLASPKERQRILALAKDLPAIWHAPTTTQVERKQLLRFLIKDVTITKLETTIHIGLRWQTEASTECHIPRPKLAHEANRTDPSVINRVRELAPTHDDRQIASILNRELFSSGMGGDFTDRKVRWVRHAYGIPTGHPLSPRACPSGQRADGRYTTPAAAELLNVSRHTIVKWCKSGRLDGLQSAPKGFWWIKLTPEIITKLRQPERRHRKTHSP